MQLIIALLHLDFITAYLSDPLISGFNAAAACQSVVAQLSGLLGLSVKKVDSQVFMLFKVRLSLKKNFF